MGIFGPKMGIRGIFCPYMGIEWREGCPGRGGRRRGHHESSARAIHVVKAHLNEKTHYHPVFYTSKI